MDCNWELYLTRSAWIDSGGCGKAGPADTCWPVAAAQMEPMGITGMAHRRDRLQITRINRALVSRYSSRCRADIGGNLWRMANAVRIGSWWCRRR